MSFFFKRKTCFLITYEQIEDFSIIIDPFKLFDPSPICLKSTNVNAQILTTVVYIPKIIICFEKIKENQTYILQGPS